MKVSVDVVKEEWELPYGGNPEVEVMENVQEGKNRWSNTYRLVVKKDDRFWLTTYERGTGDEGVRPWEYVDEVTFKEVFPWEVTKIEYREAK